MKTLSFINLLIFVLSVAEPVLAQQAQMSSLPPEASHQQHEGKGAGEKPKSMPVNTQGCPFTSLKDSSKEQDRNLATINQKLQQDLLALNNCVTSANSNNKDNNFKPNGSNGGSQSVMPSMTGDYAKADVECLGYKKNLEAEYQLVQSAGLSGASGTDYQSCFATQAPMSGNPSSPGQTPGGSLGASETTQPGMMGGSSAPINQQSAEQVDSAPRDSAELSACIERIKQSRFTEVSSYCTTERIDATKEYLSALSTSLNNIAINAALRPECLEGNGAATITRVISSLASVSGTPAGQAVGAGLNLVSTSMNLLTIMKNNSKIKKLQVAEKFAEQGCLYWIAGKSDKSYGCEEKENGDSCTTKGVVPDSVPDVMSAMKGADKDFAERNAILEQLTNDSIAKFERKLTRDREEFKKLGNPSEAINALKGMVMNTLDICMKTPGIWTRKDSKIRSTCEKALACYPDKPRFDRGKLRQQGNNGNNGCKMNQDSDAYQRILIGELIFPAAQQLSKEEGEKLQSELSLLSRRGLERKMKHLSKVGVIEHQERSKFFQDRFQKEFPGKTAPNNCMDQVLESLK